MSLKKRVFSNNLIRNYIDYNNLKNGCEHLKTIKHIDNNAVLKQFKNYESKQSLSNAYFTYTDDKIEICPITCLTETNNSFVDNHHLNKTVCQQERLVLFPTGKTIKKNKILSPLSTINLSNWCNNKNYNIDYLCDSGEHMIKTDECHCPDIKNVSFCKIPKRLFI